MLVKDIISAFESRGFTLSLTSDNSLSVTPASQLTDAERETLKENKSALLELLELLRRRAEDMRSHPCNSAAMWALNVRTRREEPAARRLDADDLCSAATEGERRAFIESLYGRKAPFTGEETT